MSEPDTLSAELSRARARFLALVADVRPELHRYCARMTGSVSEGEDIVQETLASAYYAWSELESAPSLRPWLFRIAHRRAIDHLRRYDRRMGRSLSSIDDPVDPALDPEDALAREQALQVALSGFLALPPAQRSAVILKDVLGHSLDDIAALLELSVPAIKAALHRGRVALRTRGQRAERTSATVSRLEPSPEVARYVRLFNARDWDAVRALLADDVRLDLVSRVQRTGREVGSYVTNYEAIAGWYLAPASLDGREVIAAFHQRGDARPSYFVELTFAAGRVTEIRDFRYVPYIADEAAIVLYDS